ncbi:hypothetical protein AVEN_231853-1 [Araneus ventricosus]|uniref:Uncharacterized protein n=1 Tax=Araneus ventricosus TaxID=182803 RepID=A0A4Y2LHU7_ARAVE|nr:hypothetical protein AVEN_231853-1 [Araneus ventricosus]
MHSVCVLENLLGLKFIYLRDSEKIGPSSTTMNQKKQSIHIITASDSLKTFNSQQLKIATKLHRYDSRELLNLASLMIELDIQFTIQKPGVLHRACWMPKAIYSLKMELLFNGNEARMTLTARKFQAKIEDSFFTVPVKDWPETSSYKKAAIFAKNLVCVKDVAEQAVALIKDFNCATKRLQLCNKAQRAKTVLVTSFRDAQKELQAVQSPNSP